MMILLVDDDQESSDALIELLLRRGYSVHYAPNGADALEWLIGTDAHPALVLLDLVMPVLDGWEFLKRRHDYPHLAEFPVVVMSSCHEDGPKVIDAGGIAFVAKPINPRALFRIVKHFDHTAFCQ